MSTLAVVNSLACLWRYLQARTHLAARTTEVSAMRARVTLQQSYIEQLEDLQSGYQGALPPLACSLDWILSLSPLENCHNWLGRKHARSCSGMHRLRFAWALRCSLQLERLYWQIVTARLCSHHRRERVHHPHARWAHVRRVLPGAGDGAWHCGAPAQPQRHFRQRRQPGHPGVKPQQDKVVRPAKQGAGDGGKLKSSEHW